MPAAIDRPAPSTPVMDPERPAATLEGCVPFKKVAEAYNVSRLTVSRWTTVGFPMGDGSRLLLPCFRVGRVRYVRTADLSAFLDAVNATK